MPKEILCHILSFLTTKEAALTSVLSKRWRDLIAFVPNLTFDDSVFLNPEEGKQNRYEIHLSFVYFVDRVLALQGSNHSPINKFSLKFRTTFVSSDRVDCWISNVFARGVSELEVRVAGCFQLSSVCFMSRNLVTLKLNNVGIDLLARDVFLPMLKNLHLRSVRLFVDKFSFRALPALEELFLVSMYWGDRDVIVSNATLKTLTIDRNYCLGTFSFDTPSLVYFCYSEFAAKDYPVVKMEKLFEARISLLVTEEQIERARAANNDLVEDDVVLRLVNVGNLIKGMRNVRCLNLSANTLEVLSLCCESMPVFNNLKSLTIKSNKSRGWQAMPVLLRNCPHAETLVLEGLLHYVTDNCGDACDCLSRKEKGRSLTSCPVKLLEIKGFQGTSKEMHMIKHFVDYFPCLEEIKIFYKGENCPLQLRDH